MQRNTFPRIRLPIEKARRICDRLDKAQIGERKKDIAAELEISRPTLDYYIVHREGIKQYLRQQAGDAA